VESAAREVEWVEWEAQVDSAGKVE
jgi:hypothetical protein